MSNMLHMIIEQTSKYPMRMIYDDKSNSFFASENYSLSYVRGFSKPYGWIKESGTPPHEHWDCILMSEKEYNLGDEVPIKVVGLFKRADFDHKYIAVEYDRNVNDYPELSNAEKEELSKLYPMVGEGEGWFGRHEAEYCMDHHQKAK